MSKKSLEVESSEEILNRESLKEDSFSSHEHAIDSFASEVSEYAKATDFDIPEKYGDNRVVILPVNVRTEFIYWELSDEYVRSIYDGEIQNYTIRVYEAGSETSKELTRFSVRGNLGRYYLSYYAPNRSIFGVLGVIDKNGNFIEILKSNRVTTPGDTISSEQDEVWMSKVSDWMEVIHASLERIGDKEGSAALIRERELLKRHKKLRVDMDTDILPNVMSSEEFALLGGSSEMFGSSNMSSYDMHINSTENIKKK